MGAKFIILFFSISIVTGLVLGLYIRFYREGIPLKYMFFGMKRFMIYQIWAPLIWFPTSVVNNKKMLANFLAEDILCVTDEEEKKRTVEVLVNEWDNKLTFIIWRAYLTGINNNYDFFTDQNIELVKMNIKYLKRKNEIVKESMLRKQIVLLETDKFRNLLEDRLVAVAT